MSPDWSDVAARARGLRSRQLNRDRLEQIAASDDPLAALAELGVGTDALDAAGVERALRQMQGERLARLATQAARRCGVLEVVFGEEDRRSVIALLRTVGAGRPGTDALAALIPTPRLPGRSLEVLARQTTAQALGTVLASWQHPLGSALLGASRLAEREQALHAAHGARLVRAARRGDRFLRLHTRLLLDLHNAIVALLVVGEPDDARPAPVFVPGGHTLDEPTFAKLCQGADTAEALDALSGRLRRSPLDGVFDPLRPVHGVEPAALGALIAHADPHARLDPLGTASIVRFSLGLRAEALDLRTLAWGSALGASPDALRARLVTP